MGWVLRNSCCLLMYKRPVHIHIMDVTPEFRICCNDSYMDRQPILLSYEGSNHYNTLIPCDHVFKDSRVGVEEMMVLSSTFLRSIGNQEIVAEVITSEKLNVILERKLELYGNSNKS